MWCRITFLEQTFRFEEVIRKWKNKWCNLFLENQLFNVTFLCFSRLINFKDFFLFQGVSLILKHKIFVAWKIQINIIFPTKIEVQSQRESRQCSQFPFKKKKCNSIKNWILEFLKIFFRYSFNIQIYA